MSRRFSLCLVLVLALVASPFRAAASSYLPPGTPDPVKLLPPPPAPGSREQAADLAEVFSVYSNRTPAEKAAFETESGFNAFSFSCIIGPWFREDKLPLTAKLFHKIEKDAKPVIDTAKNTWRRPRPYTIDSRFVHVAPEGSFGYPSGHSTRATVISQILAQLFPEHRDAILRMGRGIGWHRVVGGVHYPTDVFGGRVLGQALAQDFLASPKFQADLAAVRAEIAAARK